MEKDNIEALINKEYDYSNVVPDIGAIAYLIECCDKYYSNFMKLCEDDENKNMKLKSEYKNYQYKKSFETGFEIAIKKDSEFSTSLTCNNYNTFYKAVLDNNINNISSLVITLDLSYRRGKEFESENHENKFIISFKPYNILFKRKSNYTDALMDSVENMINDILRHFDTQNTIFCSKY